jgi:hypothetical protein
VIGRRIPSHWPLAALWQHGDYSGPRTDYTGGVPAVFFLLPNARDPGARGPQRGLRHVVSPPHTFRECPDGSLEIRASIGAQPYWHGYLDEGHVWREA